MKLRNLLEEISDYKVFGNINTQIDGVCEDSRKVKKADLFVAIKGLRVDGHKFIGEAIVGGAIAVVGEKTRESLKIPKSIVYVRVENSRKTLGLLAAAFYGYPSRKLKVIGVTGTDGKTTTANLIYHVLESSGKKSGLITSLGATVGKRKFDTGLHVTNPGSVDLQLLLQEMVNTNCEYAVIEVTSHGLDQERVSGLEFDSGVLTNITHDHLDYHKTWEEYRDTKLKLFKMARRFVILNKDDESYEYIRKQIPENMTISYSIQKRDSNIYAQNIKGEDSGTGFEVVDGVQSYVFETQLLGDFNISNILAALSCAKIYGVQISDARKAVASFVSPKGRLEKMETKRGFDIYIDFAHTPNALENVLNLFKKRLKVLNRGGRLIAVLGCAGERDLSKRPLMGQISTTLSDISIFTAEDPRSEDVNKIITRMVDGARKTGAKEIKLSPEFSSNWDSSREKHFYLRISDRGEAIAYAIQKVARKDDIVVILGKGHEKSMAYGGSEYPWSDQEAVNVSLLGKVMRGENLKRIHFMGIGGSGISAVALMAKSTGFNVSGCDLEENTAYLDRVKKSVKKIYRVHDEKHLKGIDLLVVSPSVLFQNKNHPEVVKAKERGILLTWEEFLGKYLLRNKKVVCISGTHGKSTTTAMAGILFEKAGFNPYAIVGAEVKEWDGNFRVGNKELFIVEADEFNNNFLNYHPEIILLNNIEFDHPDFFKDEEGLLISFSRFVKLLEGKNILIINQDSLGIKKLFKILETSFLSSVNIFGYTLQKKPKLLAKNSLHLKISKRTESETTFRARSTDFKLDEVYHLKIPGDHNVANSAGIIILAHIFGIRKKIVQELFYSFNGVARRLEFIGESKGVKVYDDYAHHPTAIKATISALKQKFPDSRILAVIEPHSFSRTKALIKKYKGVFADADKVVVGPIFNARDKKTFGVSGNSIVKVSRHRDIIYCNSSEKVDNFIKQNARSKDCILVMGAGYSYKWAREILETLRKN